MDIALRFAATRRGDPDLREDLQIRDMSPLLTVDVKGLVNFPADPDALQAHKHASIRIQEEERSEPKAQRRRG